MPEPTTAPPPPTFAYQARLLSRTSSLSRSPSILTRSPSTASSSGSSSGSASNSTLFSYTKSSSIETLEEEDMEQAKAPPSLGKTGSVGAASAVGSVREKWEARVRAADGMPPTSTTPSTTPQSTLGRAASIRTQPSSDTTPLQMKRRTLPSSFALPSAPPAPPAPPADVTPPPSTTSTPPRVRRALSFESPTASTMAPPTSTPTRAPLPRAMTTPQPPYQPPSDESHASQPQFRSAYMASKHQRSTGLGMGRKLGMHLPRIASGDGPDDDPDPAYTMRRMREELVAEREKEEKENMPLLSSSPTKERTPLPQFAPSASPPKLASSRPPNGASLRSASPTKSAPVESAAPTRKDTFPKPLTSAETPRTRFPLPTPLSSPTRDSIRPAPVAPRKETTNSVPTPATRPVPLSKEIPHTPKRVRTISFPTNEVRQQLSPAKLPAPPQKENNKEEGEDDVEVHGIPGRIRLSRNLPSLQAPSSSLPSPTKSPAKQGLFKYALWADQNRANIQAYEYLCHVGEALQWIEGSLGREVGLGVVDFEEGLRNGVILARLVQGWGAEGKVFEHPKLQWRHSDNINVFLTHVRSIGLPENFIFEFTDLYEKKNMPKVIYCIHALSHLLARRGLAQRMNNLLGRLEFTDDQLAATQKGLTGVAMPNFGSVGKELWKEMAEPEPEETEEETRDRELAEAEQSISGWQAQARGYLERARYTAKVTRLAHSKKVFVALQAQARGVIARRHVLQQRKAANSALGGSAIALQAHARGMLARTRRRGARRKLENPSMLKIVKGLQARARGLLVRRRAQEMEKALGRVTSDFVGLQASARGMLVRRRISAFLRHLDSLELHIILLQACARGALVRKGLRNAVQERQSAQVLKSVVGLQARARGLLRRRRATEIRKEVGATQTVIVTIQAQVRGVLARQRCRTASKQREAPQVLRSVVGLQARARGLLRRRRVQELSKEIGATEPFVLGFQSQVRGALVRQRIRTQLARLDAEEDVIIRMQAAVRGYLARRELLSLIRSLRKTSPVIIGLQARARACLARKAHKDTAKALADVQVVTALSGLQAFARAALTRRKHQEQSKQLAFVQPDVVGLQSQALGALARRAFGWWWHYLHGHQDEATYLQALCRGLLVRRSFHAKLEYYHANLSKVVKIQSLFRGKEQREQYRQLTMGQNVTVSTIKKFVHLLNDSETDFGDEIEVERLRKKVVEGIRENQQLETYVNDLDVKIALVVQNVKSFEELIKARRWHGVDGAGLHASRASVLAAFGDPFAGPNALDMATKRKLELYQQLFYLLQTRAEYLARLFFRMSRVDVPEKTKRTVERVVLTLFGYGQRREDYLMLKLFQHSIQEEVRAAPTIADVVEGHPMFLSVSIHYIRPKQAGWVRETLQSVIQEIVAQPDLDLETNPVMIYRAVVNAEEMRSGISSGKPVEVDFQEAAHDPNTRAEWIRHLQKLRHYTELFLTSITSSTRKLPYSIRMIAKELLTELRAKFPGLPDEQYSVAVGRLVYYRYLHPAIIAPDTFDVVPDTIGSAARRNLAEIAKMLTQISSGAVFQDDTPALIPLNAFVGTSVVPTLRWFLEVADVPNPEEHFHAHEFLDATEQPRSIVISPNEVYAMHGLLAQNLDHLTSHHDDILRVIITELDGVPHLGSEELKDARDRAVSLELTNRFADVKDPHAGEKALWVHAKRGVLAVLRVQPGRDLMESLMEPVTDKHEQTWEEIVANEIPSESIRNRRRMPSMSVSDSGYRLEDIRTQSYRDVKAQAMFYLIELEKHGKVTRTDGFQGILNAIAGDVRSKHLKRIQRRNELENMDEALKHLAERKKGFEEQIKSYHSYVDSAMNTMQRGKGKKRFVMPFTKQYFHLREIHKAGKNPQFGSYKYSAQELYDKGILLSIDQFSPRQFDRLSLVIASDQVGAFTVELYNNSYGGSALMGSSVLRMEDLLQAQFENRVSLALFDGLTKVNLNLLLYQINKKFYV